MPNVRQKLPILPNGFVWFFYICQNIKSCFGYTLTSKVSKNILISPLTPTAQHKHLIAVIAFFTGFENT
jgi:hypothetical protein